MAITNKQRKTIMPNLDPESLTTTNSSYELVWEVSSPNNLLEGEIIVEYSETRHETITPSQFVTIVSADHTTQQIVAESIENLLKRIDLLGYQLSHANNDISDEEFEETIESYLTPNQYDKKTIIFLINRLMPFIINEERVSPEVFSSLFWCEIDTIDEAINELLLNHPPCPSLPQGERT